MTLSQLRPLLPRWRVVAPAGGWATGADSARCLQGRTGLQGDKDDVGPTGSIGPAVFLYADNSSQETLPEGSAITFDLVGPMLGGITVDATRSRFTVSAAGVYKITFGVLADTDSQFDILVNDEVPEIASLLFGGVGGMTNEGTAVLALAAGENVTLVNRGTDDVELTIVPRGGTQAELNAWIVIEQLN